MHKQNAILLFLLIFFFSCDSNNPESVCNNNREINEYEVFSAVVNEIYENTSQTVVILQKTEKDENEFKLKFNDEWLEDVREKFPDFDILVADDFNFNNRQSKTLEQKLNISMPYKFASEDDYNEISSAGYPKYFDKFKEKFPEAVSPNSSRMIRLSKVGFNKNLNQAILYVEVWASRRSYFLLKRQNCYWKVIHESAFAHQ